jgi:predicted dehydrogenase
MKKVNWGIIGLGGIAEVFSDAFDEAENAQLLAVASREPKKLDYFKDRFNLENKFLFNNYEDLILCSEVDIVYIALPNSLHHRWIIECIKNKKNILVEKPATLTFADTTDIKKNLNNNNLFFSEAFMYRYLPQIDLVINAIKKKEIGNLLSMEASFGVNLLTKKKFFLFNKKKKINRESRIFNKNLGGGCIFDLGCYSSSFSLLIASLLDNHNINNLKLINIQNEIGETGVDIDSCAELLFENGFKSIIRASFKRNLGNKSIITGDKGSLIINDTWKGNKIIKKTDNFNEELKLNTFKNIYTHQIIKISNNIINKENKPNFPGMNLDETILNSKILEKWTYAQK